MRRTIAAQTAMAVGIYPPFFNITSEEDGSVTVTVRAPPKERDGVYVCGFAGRDTGKPGRCTPGGPDCNNYCNMDPAGGPMADKPKDCHHVDEGAQASWRMSAADWEAMRAQIVATGDVVTPF